MKKIVMLLAAFFAATSLSAAAFEVSFSPGERYSHKHRFGLVPVTLTPQFAIWIEDDRGAFLDTLFVTYKSAKAKWGAFGVRRPEALPVWAHRRRVFINGSYMPTANNPLPDALTGATPEGSFKKMLAVPVLTPGKYKIFLEMNTSFDFNESYKKNKKWKSSEYNVVNGQPSLVYVARIDTSVLGAKALFELAGRGDTTGITGTLSKDISGITTAKQILSHLEVLYVP